MSEKVKNQYDKVATRYDSRWKIYVDRSLEGLCKKLKLMGSEKLLDVACGTGELERILVKKFPGLTIYGTDFSSGMLRVAKEKLHSYKNVFFHNVPADRMPFEDQMFDLVVSANAFHYFPDPVTALKEMKRVLKSNGRLVIMDWSRDFLLCAVFDRVLKFFDSAHSQCYTKQELTQFGEEANCEIRNMNLFRLGLFWGLMVGTFQPKPE